MEYVARPDLLGVIPKPLEDWERRALEILRQLRREKKPAILWVDASGAVKVFRGEPAGIIPPP